MSYFSAIVTIVFIKVTQYDTHYLWGKHFFLCADSILACFLQTNQRLGGFGILNTFDAAEVHPNAIVEDERHIAGDDPRRGSFHPGATVHLSDASGT